MDIDIPATETHVTHNNSTSRVSPWTWTSRLEILESILTHDNKDDNETNIAVLSALKISKVTVLTHPIKLCLSKVQVIV